MKTIRRLFNSEHTAGIMFTLPFTLGFLFFIRSVITTFCQHQNLQDFRIT